MTFLKSRKQQAGFTMVETIIVLGIGLVVGALTINAQKKERERMQGQNVGLHMKIVADAANTYVVSKYAQLSTLTNAPGTPADPGPRTCVAATNLCTITLATLTNEGLLPTGAAAAPPFAGYTITLRRSGVAPNWQIDGLVATATGWMEGANPRLDLVGEAVRNIGPDGGMTSGSTTTVSGYQGTWTALNTTYPNITANAQVFARIGNGSMAYGQFLRRDGTLPMTGALDMGGNNINNANNVTANNVTSNNISTPNAGCKRVELTSTGQMISRNAGCVTRFASDPNTGQTVAYDTAGNESVKMIHDDAASYGALEVRRWGLNKPNGHLYLEHNPGYNMYLTPNSWNPNDGTLVTNYRSTSFAGEGRFAGDVYINGRAQPLSALLPDYVARGVFQVAHGWGVNKPTCATGGTPKIIVTPAVMTSAIIASGSWFYNANGFVATAIDYGTWWGINLQGWPTGAPGATHWGLAHRYCYYP